MRKVVGGLLLLALAVVGAGAGCATEESPREQLLKRAAFDLRCTKDELRVTKIDERTRGVRGCGKRATYVQSCGQVTPFEDCTWVMNTRSRDQDDD